MTGTTDEFTLLCEDCAYVIDGLARDGPCPECGKPIVGSLPERRAGSAWQRERTWRAWVATAAACLCRRGALFSSIRVDRPSFELGQINTVAAALLIAAALALPNGDDSIVGADWRTIIISASLFLPVWLVLMCFAALERPGVRLWGRRRGWRVTRGVASAVISHASAGWLLIGPTAAAAWGFLRFEVGADWPWRVSKVAGNSLALATLLPLALGTCLGLASFRIRVTRACNSASSRTACPSNSRPTPPSMESQPFHGRTERWIRASTPRQRL